MWGALRAVPITIAAASRKSSRLWKAGTTGHSYRALGDLCFRNKSPRYPASDTSLLATGQVGQGKHGLFRYLIRDEGGRDGRTEGWKEMGRTEIFALFVSSGGVEPERDKEGDGWMDG